MLVTRIIRFSAVDGPGNRSVIFLQGCNYNCSFCHNPETIPLSSSEAKQMSVEEVFEEIGSAIHFIEGITVSGGECTLQRNAIKVLFEKAKELQLTTFIDSNGSFNFARDKELLNLTDSVMLDVKSTDDKEHHGLTGITNRIVLKNIDTLGEQNKLYEIRTVISPGMIDCERTVAEAARRIRKYPNTRYKIIQYRQYGVRSEYAENLAIPSLEYLKTLEAIALENGAANVIIT